jgi:hypothetical protein
VFPGSSHRLIVGALACLVLGAASGAAFGPGIPTAARAASSGKADTPAAPRIDPASRREDFRSLNKYPDEASHRKAEALDLQAVIDRLRQPNARLAELIAASVPLDKEADFYKGKRLSPALQGKVDENEASFTALIDVFRLLEQDVDFIVAKYRNDREHFAKLWAGAPPGSIGFLKPLSR